MAEQFQLFFIQRFKGKVLFNVPMSEYTSLGVGGPADVMAFPKDEADLKDIISFAATKRFPVFVLGGGTNLLVKDRGIRGIVINMTEGFKDIAWRNTLRAVVGAGMSLGRLVRKCSERGLSGLEFAEGIPGTVGGAVMMNAGAFDGEMKDVVEGVELMGRKGKKGFLPAKEIGFGYRSSGVPKDSIVIRVQMKFESVEPSLIEEKIKEMRQKRRASAPVGVHCAGSIFKNPEGSHAGRLIDEAGLKGMRMGYAEVSAAHANYIVNTGRAMARDVLGLMGVVRDKVYREFGVSLEPEIKVVGED